MGPVAIVLSGCGYKDGSEITEAVSLLIALSEKNIPYKIFAPSLKFSATFHRGEGSAGDRNTLEESARIARGHVDDLNTLQPAAFEGLAFPGGFGAAVHLCNFASQGAKATVLPVVKKTIESFYNDQKPILAMCIAPALVSCVLGHHHVTVTIGNDADTAAELAKTGAVHENCAVDHFITDRDHRVVTTPAYMYDSATPIQVFTGVRKAVQEFLLLM
jgi:enhancing lycopene biosynthesis protein 2